LQLTMPLIKSFCGCYFGRCCNKAAMELEWRQWRGGKLLHGIIARILLYCDAVFETKIVHISWEFICQMRGLFVWSEGEINGCGGGSRPFWYVSNPCIKWQLWVSNNQHNNTHCPFITATTH
jgi:hypothetical protein